MAQRVRRFAGLGGPAARSGATDGAFPSPNGAPGSLVYPYDEHRPLFGTPDDGTGVSAPVDPNSSVPVAPGASASASAGGISVPYGESDTPWNNPTTFQLVPILSTTPANVPVLSLNMKRNMLLIQNNSSAATGNTAPTFYIGFNSQAQVGLSLALLPGSTGILFDIICPRDSVYVTIAGGSGPYPVAGCVGQGTYSPM